MRRAFLGFAIVLTLFIVFGFGCSEDCEECPDTCDTLYVYDTLYDTLIVCDTIVICDSNYTNLDPPFIEDVIFPEMLTAGQSGAFACSVLSDAPIISYAWYLFAQSGDNANYFYPADLTEGPFTPTGAFPFPFVEQDTGAAVNYTYDYRGRYDAVLRIEDEDGYVEYSGANFSVDPSTPDTPGPDLIVRAGIEDSLMGDEFDFQRFSLLADNAVPAAVYSDGIDVVHAFAHTSGDYIPGARYIQTRADIGRIVLLEGYGDFICELKWDIDIKGALHYQGSDAGDVVMYSIYSIMKMDDSFPQSRCIYRQTLTGDGGDQAYYIDHNLTITDSVLVWGMHEYEVWLGVETVQMLSGGAGSASAVSFDGTDGLTQINKLNIYMDK